MAWIEPDHPDRDDPLLATIAAVLEDWGARVVIDRSGENLVEVVVGGQPVVRAQGLPNLVHEFVHVLHAGGLADDHGIDYGRIPFDLATSAGRAVLWDELSCCVTSCMYLSRDADIDAWFAEQLEIQPVFYGAEHRPARFWQQVDRLVDAYRDDLDAVLETALRRFRAVLERQLGARVAPRRSTGWEPLWCVFAEKHGVVRGAECAEEQGETEAGTGRVQPPGT